jgi:hypothetical protein
VIYNCVYEKQKGHVGTGIENHPHLHESRRDAFSKFKSPWETRIGALTRGMLGENNKEVVVNDEGGCACLPYVNLVSMTLKVVKEMEREMLYTFVLGKATAKKRSRFWCAC